MTQQQQQQIPGSVQKTSRENRETQKTWRNQQRVHAPKGLLPEIGQKKWELNGSDYK